MKKESSVFTGRAGISAKVIAHSAHPAMECRQLITLQLRYPRFIHSELMTHRVFSRNASSSRAIPVAKMLKQVREDPAMPFHWGVNEPGMQAHKEMNPQDARIAEVYWREAAKRAADMAEQLHNLGSHKQVANRVLEPYQFMSVILSFTEGENFFSLRDHDDAEPQIRELAVVMKGAIAQSTPDRLAYGDWHLPYVTDLEKRRQTLETCQRISAARCARVSYLTHDGETPDIKKDVELFDKLVGSDPMHASPIEHQGTPKPPVYHSFNATDNAGLEGNFVDWIQFRKLWGRKAS